MAEDEDLPLTLQISSIWEDFQCPICFNPIGDCVITPCGHNFCRLCVEESINRRHQCPCCNNGLQATDLIKNHHFDKVLKIIAAERAKSSEAYFTGLISGATQQAQLADTQVSSWNTEGPGSRDGDTDGKNSANPVEAIFSKYAQESLQEYNRYYQDMIKKREAAKYSAIQEHSNGSDRTDLDALLTKIGGEFSESIAALLASYERHMSVLAPRPDFVPFSVEVRVACTDATVSVELPATATIQDLKKRFETAVIGIGDRVLEWSDANVFVVETVNGDPSPLCGGPSTLLRSLGVGHATKLTLVGLMALQSIKERVCFSTEYESGATTDYYTCSDCKLNWICPGCTKACHKDHKVRKYLENHKPKWGCCYCATKNKNPGCCLVVKKGRDESSASTTGDSNHKGKGRVE